MRTAIYARYSTDKQSDASIDDQVRNCTRCCDGHGWEVQQVYKDEAISGAVRNRPGYQQMIADAEAGKFEALVVDDLSRLSRDELEMKHFLRRLQFKNIRVIGCSDSYDSESKSHKINATFRGLMNEMYIDDLREKTRRGMAGKALKGNSCGGRTYGYRPVPVIDSTRQDEFGRPLILYVQRAIDESEAHWVRKIFQWFADGYSPRWIANELNRQGVSSPRGTSWGGSTIYGHMDINTGLLNNDLYIGRYEWNRSRWVKDLDTGKRKRIQRPKEEWIATELPELRIIPQPLWEAVKERQKKQYGASVNRRAALHRNERNNGIHKYLFSGLMRCDCCGAKYIMVDRYRYGCGRHKDRGESVCSNSLKVPRLLLESRLLAAIKADLFTEEYATVFHTEVARILEEKKKQQVPERALLKQRLAKIEAEIENIMSAIRQGIVTNGIKMMLEKAEQEQGELNSQLKQFDSQSDGNILEMLPRAMETYRKLVETFEEMSTHPRIRKNISTLVGDEIVMKPAENGFLQAELYGDYSGLLSLNEESKLVLVAGARFELTTFRL